MNARLWCLASALAFACVCLSRQPIPSSARADIAYTSPAPSRYVGAGSCSASACHNANNAHGSSGSEYATWITRDPHARAYEVLFNERSRAMQKNLHRTVAAHDDGRCLRCHVAPDYDVAKPPSTFFKTDGVSCESCHGPAREWINHHHLDAWQQTSTKEKVRLGMNDTRSLIGRAQVCAKCHVGAAGMDVDHELIAAGHPRLHFEFSAFHANMPRHWPDAKERAGKSDFETQAWVAGQLATAHAALELLAARAGNASAWPEFAEFDCAACHHNLQDPSPRQKLGVGARKPGALPWGHHVTLLPIALQNSDKLSALLQSLQKSMDAGNPNRIVVMSQARAAESELRALFERADRNAVQRGDLERQLLTYGQKKGATSDELTQVYLGLTAVGRTSFKAPRVQQFDPEAIRIRLTPLKEISKDR